MDKGRLFRLAASYLGESEVREETPLYAALKGAVQHAVALALDYNHWDFALEYAEVVCDGAGVYALPADALEVREVVGLDRWRVRGRWLVADAAAGQAPVRLGLWYKSSKLADAVALPDTAPLFCEGVALLLAARVAGVVTGRFDMVRELEGRAWRVLYRAKLKEARSVASNDQAPVRAVDKEGLYG